MIPQEFIRKIREIEIRTKRIVNTTFAGEYKSSFKGTGIEFVDVREYLPGDDVRSIDWKVTARMGRPFVKKFVEERELTVILCVDASGSGHFGTGRGDPRFFRGPEQRQGRVTLLHRPGGKIHSGQEGPVPRPPLDPGYPFLQAAA